MRERKKGRVEVFSLVVAGAIFLTACGGHKAGENPAGKEMGEIGNEKQFTVGQDVSEEIAKAMAYAPEFLDLERALAESGKTGAKVLYSGMKLAGAKLYFLFDVEIEGKEQQNLCIYSLEERNVVQMPLSWPEDWKGSYLGNYVFGEDGSVHGLVYETAGNSDQDGSEVGNGDKMGSGRDGAISELMCSLVKFDEGGNWIGSWDVTEQLQEENEGEHATYLAVDFQGRVYLFGYRMVWLFGDDGTFKGSLDLGGGNRINAFGCGSDGRMYVSFCPDGHTEGCTLARVDFEQRKTVEVASNFPYSNGSRFCAGQENSLLVQDDIALYKYDLEAKEKETLLVWEESSIGGSWVESVELLEDGRLLAVLEDREGDNSGAVLLDRAGAEQAPQKETLVMGTLYIDYDSQDWVNRFNMKNEKYRIQIKEYSDETALNLDIAAGRCPDIIEFGNLHVEYMIEKGMFEDLGPYLEKSEKLSREDFFEGIMNAYLFDGIQVALPKGFELYTVVGKTEVVGSEMGWTLDEMIEFAKAHPDCILFDSSKATVMRILMRYNEELFVNWETGKCSFDSEEFRRLLEFVNSGPEKSSWELGESYVAKIREGEVLLHETSMQIEEIQVLEEIFGGEITFKGLPTSNGSSGATASWSAAYAISAKSKHKDVAWDFLETFFTESDRRTGWFPGLKRDIEDGILQAMKINHDGIEYGDHIGEIDGEPYIYRAATQGEVDRILELIDAVEPLAAQCDKEIENIVIEEAESYFKGQKTAEEVMAVIQGRVQIYVSEKL